MSQLQDDVLHDTQEDVQCALSSTAEGITPSDNPSNPDPVAGHNLSIVTDSASGTPSQESPSVSYDSEAETETDDGSDGNETPLTTPDDDTSEKSAGHVQSTPLLSLTDLGSGDPAATEWVRYLIQAVGRDVLSFRRNTQVSYMVVQRARDIVNAINKYIANVDEDDTEDGDWVSFFKYSKAIKPFEEKLLELLDFTESEKAQYFASTASIHECIASAERWATNREMLSGALEEFHTREALVGLFDDPDVDSRQDERRQAQIHDDMTLLGEMRDSISALISEVPNRYPSYVRNVVTSLTTLQNQVIDESPAHWPMDITIQTSMLIEGVLKMVEVSSFNLDTMNHLKSKPVWEAASVLIQALVAAVELQPASPDSARTAYDAFVVKLQTLGVLVLPKTYIRLLKVASRIRRPFQAQAFALVTLCSNLTQTLERLGKSVVTVETVNALEEAFEKASVALRMAVQSITQLGSFEMIDFENDATVQAFLEVQELIREIFESVDLEDEWEQQELALNAAFEEDKVQMEKLNNIFSKNPSPKTAKVRVIIHEQSTKGKVLGDISVKEESSARLLAVRWNVAGAPMLKPDVIKKARNAGTFYEETANDSPQPIDPRSALQEILGNDSEVTLKLVVS